MKGCCDEQYAEQRLCLDGNAYVGVVAVYTTPHSLKPVNRGIESGDSVQSRQEAAMKGTMNDTAVCARKNTRAEKSGQSRCRLDNRAINASKSA